MFRRLRRRPLLLAALVVSTLCLSACAPMAEQGNGQMKTIAVASVTNYDKLMPDIAFLGSLFGLPDADQTAELMLKGFIQDKGMAAIDKSRPWGLIVLTDGSQVVPIGCLPITKPADLIAVADLYGIPVSKGPNGTTQIMLENTPIFVKLQNDWSLIGQTAESFANVPADFPAQLAKLAADYDIGVTGFIKNVPESARKMFMDAMQQGMQQGLARRLEESDEDFSKRQTAAKAQMDQVTKVFDEVDSLTFGWSIDSPQQRSFMDFVYNFTPGGEMATQLKALQPTTTGFAGFFLPDAAVTLTSAQQIDLKQLDAKAVETQREQAKVMINQWREQSKTFIADKLDITDEGARAAVRAAANDLFDAYTAQMEAGKTDIGASLRVRQREVTLIAATSIRDTVKIEGAISHVASGAGKFPLIKEAKMNAAEHAGVKFHQLTIDLPEDAAPLAAILGDTFDLVIGIGNEAVYLALGHEHLATVRQAIDTSRTAPKKPAPMFEMAVSLGPIIEAVAAAAPPDDMELRPTLQMLAMMLKNDAQGRDHIRAVGQMIPNGMKVRFEAEEGVLRSLGVAIGEIQRQLMGLR